VPPVVDDGETAAEPYEYAVEMLSLSWKFGDAHTARRDAYSVSFRVVEWSFWGRLDAMIQLSRLSEQKSLGGHSWGGGGLCFCGRKGTYLGFCAVQAGKRSGSLAVDYR
jgi:hypothetical protein